MDSEQGREISELERLLVVDSDQSRARRFQALAAEGLGPEWEVVSAATERDVRARLDERRLSALLLGPGLTPAQRASAISRARTLVPSLAAVAAIDGLDAESAVSAIAEGTQEAIPVQSLTPPEVRRAVLCAVARKRSELALAHAALHDPLTGLPNRSLFGERLRIALERLRRTGGSVAVMFMDLDGFKALNDARGHAVGDAVLIEVAARLRRVVRPIDTIARYGGDEFTVLLDEVGEERDVLLVAERIFRVIGEPLTPSDGDEIELTASIGAAVASDPATPPEDLIAQADGAMYRSKQHGGGRAQLPGREVRQRTHEVMVLEHELEHAIASGELSVYFQPRIGLGSGDLDGLEALVRWPHPQRGLLAPSEFLAVAEQSGLIVALGSVVADQAFSGLRLLRRGAPRATVSINLSPRELRDPSLPSLLADLAGAYELEPGAVVVEVSERAVDSDPPAAEAALSRLKHEGICVAIDDFGTGAASLSRVGRLPIDQLKLHESMVARLDHDDRHAEQFVGAAIDLGHALGLSVVAEGVETERQLERLRALGCDCAQGNLLGPPRPAGDFLGGGR